MIYIDFEGLVRFYGELSRNKITVSQVAEETGITRKALSWLKNHPTSSISSEHLGTLCEFFFHKLLPFARSEANPGLLMEWIVGELTQVYPNSEEYKFTRASAFGELLHLPSSDVPPNVTWTGYALEKKKMSPEEVFSRGRRAIREYLFTRSDQLKVPEGTTSKKKRDKNNS